MRCTIPLLGILLVLPGRAAEAQADIGATAIQLRAAAELRHLGQPAQADQLHRVAFAGEPAHDYRWEGLAIGAGVFGLAGALLLHGTCEAEEACTGPAVGGFVLGAVVGGVTGGLVGSVIPKGKQ